jgi:hypothetical protein
VAVDFRRALSIVKADNSLSCVRAPHSPRQSISPVYTVHVPTVFIRALVADAKEGWQEKHEEQCVSKKVERGGRQGRSEREQQHKTRIGRRRRCRCSSAGRGIISSSCIYLFPLISMREGSLSLSLSLSLCV